MEARRLVSSERQARVEQRAIGFAGWVSALVVMGVLLAVYGLTLAPTITWAHHGADGGDLVTAVVRGSIPHPPGFPTYVLLGELFIRLPWGNPAWRLNLMSATLAAGAAALTAVDALSLSGKSREMGRPATCDPQPSVCNLQSAICTGLSLGLAPLFWSQALIAEVYAPAAFFVALVMLVALQGGPAWALGLAWGIGMGAHMTLLFLAPVVVWGVWKGGEKGLGQRLGQVGLLALAGGGMVCGLGLLARGSVPSPWGDVSTLESWWALASGQMYRGYLFGLPASALPRRLLAWIGLLIRQFTPLGAVGAGLGWVYLWREFRAFAAVSGLVFGMFSLYAVGYDTADSLVYLVPGLQLAALWLGAGLVQAAAWLDRRLRLGAKVLLLLPILQALLFWGQMDLSDDRTAMVWADEVLQQAPPQAIILTDQDRYTFTLWYVRDVLGQRPDVVVIDVDLWAQESYRRIVANELGFGAVESSLLAEEAANRAGRPVVRVVESSDQVER
jgi:hypothetical protein